MESRETNGDGRGHELDREIERYRQAALRALDELEWCINYLYGQRRASIARRLSATESRSWSASARRTWPLRRRGAGFGTAPALARATKPPAEEYVRIRRDMCVAVRQWEQVLGGDPRYGGPGTVSDIDVTGPPPPAATHLTVGSRVSHATRTAG